MGHILWYNSDTVRELGSASDEKLVLFLYEAVLDPQTFCGLTSFLFVDFCFSC